MTIAETDGDTQTDAASSDPEQVAEALAERLFEAGLGALELATVSLGKDLGLYRAMADGSSLTSDELAERASIHPRYATEWLEQQAAAGIITVDDAASPAEDRRYSLHSGSEAVLLDEESLAYTVPMAELVASVGRVMPQLTEAYRQGTGVPYADYGMHDAQGAFNRPVFTNLLASEWLSAVPDVHERLSAGGAVAEIGCGEGWAAIALAKAYPSITVDGFDIDDASVAAARRHASEAGVADRVRFEVQDVTDPSLGGEYAVVFAFEMLHDLSRPVDALRVARRLSGGQGPVIVMDERAADTFTAPADSVERFLYGASVLHCLPVGMVEQPSAGTGTVMRPDTVRRYAKEAGFATTQVLPIEHDLFRFYRMDG